MRVRMISTGAGVPGRESVIARISNPGSASTHSGGIVGVGGGGVRVGDCVGTGVRVGMASVRVGSGAVDGGVLQAVNTRIIVTPARFRNPIFRLAKPVIPPFPLDTRIYSN